MDRECNQDQRPVSDSAPDQLSRRRFLKIMAGTLGGLAAAGSGTFVVQKLLDRWSVAMAKEVDEGIATHRWVMVIDLVRCDGCRKCADWCRDYHRFPEDQDWLEVYKLKADLPEAVKGENTDPDYFLPRPCMQCDDAPCVKVCPVGATYKAEDGIVLIDHDRCIGCRLCMAACPYNARYFNFTDVPVEAEGQHEPYSPAHPYPFKRGTVVKCVFCASRVRKGELPACVEGCTASGMKAIFFGDENEDIVTNGEEVVRLSELLREGGAYRYKEELGTHPRVYYLPPRTKGA